MPLPPRAAWRLYTPRGQRKYLNAEERQHLLNVADGQTAALRAFCYLLVWSGCRLSEALKVRAGDIDVAAGIVAIRSLKKRVPGVVREVPLPAEVIDLVSAAFLDAQPGVLLWPWGRTTAWRYIKEVMASAGVAGLHASPKGLRHGFGVHAFRSGVPLPLVQKWLGHEDISTTAIYTAVMGLEEREIAGRMW